LLNFGPPLMLIGKSEERSLTASAWCMDSFNCVVRHSRPHFSMKLHFVVRLF
jgi:hypothetical protein